MADDTKLRATKEMELDAYLDASNQDFYEVWQSPFGGIESRRSRVTRYTRNIVIIGLMISVMGLMVSAIRNGFRAMALVPEVSTEAVNSYSGIFDGYANDASRSVQNSFEDTFGGLFASDDCSACFISLDPAECKSIDAVAQSNSDSCGFIQNPESLDSGSLTSLNVISAGFEDPSVSFQCVSFDCGALEDFSQPDAWGESLSAPSQFVFDTILNLFNGTILFDMQNVIGSAAGIVFNLPGQLIGNFGESFIRGLIDATVGRLFNLFGYLEFFNSIIPAEVVGFLTYGTGFGGLDTIFKLAGTFSNPIGLVTDVIANPGAILDILDDFTDFGLIGPLKGLIGDLFSDGFAGFFSGLLDFFQDGVFGAIGSFFSGLFGASSPTTPCMQRNWFKYDGPGGFIDCSNSRGEPMYSFNEYRRIHWKRKLDSLVLNVNPDGAVWLIDNFDNPIANPTWNPFETDETVRTMRDALINLENGVIDEDQFWGIYVVLLEVRRDIEGATTNWEQRGSDYDIFDVRGT